MEIIFENENLEFKNLDETRKSRNDSLKGIGRFCTKRLFNRIY